MKEKKKYLKISNEIGKKGEDLACMFLMKRGYEIVARNYLKRWGEIDIVVQRHNKLVFIEVKAVSCKTLPDVSYETSHRPEDNVHGKKLRALGRVVETYLFENNAYDSEWSFGIITVHISQEAKMARVRLIPDIVL